MNLLGTIVRFVVSALVLMVVGFLVPGFSRLTFGSALLAAIVIAIMGWVVERLFGGRVAPYGRGIIGFVVSVAVIYLAQIFVPGMRVTLLGAVIASLVIALIDLFIPGDVKGNLSGSGSRNGRRLRDRNDD